MALQAAHLLLQYWQQGLPAEASIWQGHRRTAMPDARAFFQQKMHIPLDSEALAIQIRDGLERLRISSSDLFAPGES